MSDAATSLRLRLLLLLLGPLIVLSAALGYWRYTVALQTAESLFDRTLLARDADEGHLLAFGRDGHDRRRRKALHVGITRERDGTS